MRSLHARVMLEFSPQLTALEALRRYRLPLPFADAHDYLCRTLQSIQLLSLYRIYFPEEYARSKKRPFPTDEEAYSPMETEFVELVDERLFPLHTEFMLYGSGPDERSIVIPVRSLGMDWWNVDYDDLSPGWRLILFLVGEMHGDDLTLHQPELRPGGDSPLRGLVWQNVEWDIFEERWKKAAQTLHPSVASVPLAVKMAYHDTENAFLDTTDEMPLEDCYWNREDMDFLITHYRQADTMIDQINELLEWLGADPEHLQAVLSLLKEDRRTWTTAKKG